MSCSLLVALLCLGSARGYSRVASNSNGQARSQDVLITVSPIYAATPRSVDDLRPGEAVDHPSTAKYSTLDQEMLAKLDAFRRNRAQDRFHPPSKFEHILSHSNALRQPSGSAPAGAASNNDVMYTKPMVSMTYDYPQASFDSAPIYSPAKLPDSYSGASNDSPPPGSASDYPSKPPSVDFGHPPKSLDFDELPSYIQPEEVIYEPEDHFHHHHHHHDDPAMPTSEHPPETMDQRLNKRPYSYYYIGKKLWYVPLYFSIYFIIYIAALVLKSVARHKINFPANLAAAAEGARGRELAHGWRDYLEAVLEGIEKYGRMP